MSNIIVKNGTEVSLASGVLEMIKARTEALKQAKKAEEELKAAIAEAMAENNVYRLDNEEAGLSIIYFPETETTVFDQNAFAAEMPDLYLDYCTKKRKTKHYIKINIKGQKTDVRPS